MTLCQNKAYKIEKVMSVSFYAMPGSIACHAVAASLVPWKSRRPTCG